MADSPRTIHESEGLRIWQNPRNGFVVARLHFTADARKRSDEWIAASRRGMSNAKWRQEFNIEYDAQQGEKAFPEIVSRRQDIVHREGPYVDGLFPAGLPMWAGFDYGAKNPSSFHVYTVVDGVTWAIWELYEPCKNIITFVQALKACPYWNQIRYIVHDPDMGNLKHRNMDTGLTDTVISHFIRLGVTKLMPGSTDESAWLAVMAGHWCGSEITFKILETCPRMIDEFEHATYVSITDRQLETQNYREALIDKHNHAMDDCKYFMNSGAARTRPKPLKLPTLVAGYGWSGGNANINFGRESELGVRI